MKKALLLLAVLLLVASPVMAKEGFYLGVFYPAETISGDAGSTTTTSSGGGWGLRLGEGFNRYLSIEARYSDTTHDSTHLKGLAGDLKLNFPLTSLDSAQIMTFEPYIMGGYVHYELSGFGSPQSNGLQYGIGVELYLFRELSIQAGWTDSKVEFNSNSGDVKTVDFGLIYHFI